jgi:hypothetical protein
LIEVEVMSRVKLSIPGISLFLLPLFMSACATMPPQPQIKAAVLSRTGNTVQLFYGGNNVAGEEFRLNEVVPVYRYYGNRYKQAVEVGKVKITGYMGDHYLEGVVVEGNIKDDDVAMKPEPAKPEPNRV